MPPQSSVSRAPARCLLTGFVSDRRGDFARHLQLVVLAADAVALSDEREVGVGDLGRAIGGFPDEHPHRPVEPGIGVSLDELDTERRVTEQDQRRFADRKVRSRAQLLLIDGDKIFDALGFDGDLDAGYGVVDRMAARSAKHAGGVLGGGGRCRRSEGRASRGEHHGEAKSTAQRLRYWKGSDHGKVSLFATPICRATRTQRNWKPLWHRCRRRIAPIPSVGALLHEGCTAEFNVACHAAILMCGKFSLTELATQTIWCVARA